MKAKLIKIGNSHGVRIPKPLLEECAFGEVVQLTVKGHRLIIEPVQATARQGWEEAFKQVLERDGTLGENDAGWPEEMEHSWDEEEWTW